MLSLFKGDTKTVYPTCDPSDDFSHGDAVEYTNGGVVPASSSTSEVYGVVHGDHDSDTAAEYHESENTVPVRVPTQKHVQWIADTQNAVADDEGKNIDFADAGTVDRSSTSNGPVEVVGIRTADKLIVEFN